MALPLKISLSLLALTALSSCVAGPQQYTKPGYRPPPLVAVLPMDNHTNDLDGPDVVRFWFDQRLREKKGYATMPIADMDERLQKMGIVDGGQLPTLTCQKLGEALGVGALIYGDLLNFDYSTAGFVNVKRVKAHYRMVDARTGELMWESEGLGANSTGALSAAAALQAGMKALGSQLADKAFGSPLKEETWDMVWNAIEYLPSAR